MNERVVFSNYHVTMSFKTQKFHVVFHMISYVHQNFYASNLALSKGRSTGVLPSRESFTTTLPSPVMLPQQFTHLHCDAQNPKTKAGTQHRVGHFLSLANLIKHGLAEMVISEGISTGPCPISFFLQSRWCKNGPAEVHPQLTQCYLMCCHYNYI